MTEKRIIGICVIALLVAAMVGFIIGMGVGGHWGEKPYLAERAMISASIEDAFSPKSKLSEEESNKRISCAAVAWHHATPVDNFWWQECLRGFPKDDT